jgi:hypothetical protein
MKQKIQNNNSWENLCNKVSILQRIFHVPLAYILHLCTRFMRIFLTYLFAGDFEFSGIVCS